MKKLSMTACKLGWVGVVSLAVVLILRYGIISRMMTSQIAKSIRLEPGTKLWDVWTDIPIPIFSKFHFFNVTNPDQVVNGQKPVVVEMGPYVYQEKRMKVILNVNDETVKYRPRTTWNFRPDLSFGTEDDKITMLNIPFVGVSKMAWEMSKQPYVLATLNDMLAEKGEKVFQSNKVREFLFDGVPIDNYMELLSLPVGDMFGAEVKVPERLLDGDFGFYDDKNGTADDIWIVKTGKENPADFGRVVSWNGKTRMDAWKSDQCNEMRGTDGSIFPPFADETRVLHVFTPELCRSLQMNYAKQGDYQGISTMLFTFAPNTFGSLKEFPENECYCKDTYEHCRKGGVMPIGPCQAGAPLFLSKPHFMDAHPDFKKGVEGLNQQGDYQSYIQLEKYTGMVIGGTFRLQMNAELQPYDDMPTFATVPSVMFPLMWVEQTALATDELLAPIKTLAKYISILNAVTGLLLTGSTICIVLALLWSGKTNNWNIRNMIISKVL